MLGKDESEFTPQMAQIIYFKEFKNKESEVLNKNKLRNWSLKIIKKTKRMKITFES